MEKISGIWENKYVCELGIAEHLGETAALYEAWQVAKARKSGESEEEAKNLRLQWEKECADLYLILDKFLSPEIVSQRLERFAQKRKEEDLDFEERSKDCK